MSALEKAIEVAGGLSKLAEKIGATPQVIVNWRKRGSVPPDRVLAVEAATVVEANGEPRVTRYDLRPDIYGERAAA